MRRFPAVLTASRLSAREHVLAHGLQEPCVQKDGYRLIFCQCGEELGFTNPFGKTTSTLDAELRYANL